VHEIEMQMGFRFGAVLLRFLAPNVSFFIFLATKSITLDFFVDNLKSFDVLEQIFRSMTAFAPKFNIFYIFGAKFLVFDIFGAKMQAFDIFWRQNFEF
jgi:hypothetical protein